MNATQASAFMEAVIWAYSIIGSLHTGDYKWPEQAVVSDGSTFDFIIVGGGTAGCVLAARLAEDKKTQVLMIEAGGNPPDESELAGLLIFLEDKNHGWNTTTFNDGSARCHKDEIEDLYLGYGLGGTSSSNFLISSQGHYADYDDWAKLANDSTWNWEEVLPYFRKASTFHGLDTSQTENKYYGDDGPIILTKDLQEDFNEIFLKAFEEAGEKIMSEINGKETMGYSKAMYNIGGKTSESPKIRQSTAHSYLKPVKDYPNIHVLKNTMAKNILFDDTKKAIGVEVVSEDKTVMKLMASKEVIVSCGAINSPKLLMLSGIGPKEHLEDIGIEVMADLPVGQNYHDHVSTILILNMTNLPNTNVTRDPHEYPAHTVVGYSNTDKTSVHPSYATINWVNYVNNLQSFCTWTYNLNDEMCNDLFDAENTNQMLWTILTYLHPESRGEVLLRSADFTDTPIVKTGFFSNKQDVEHQVNAVKDFLRVLDTPSFEEAGAKLVVPKLPSCDEFVFLSTNYLNCYITCMNNSRRNYCGTVAMGSVVDSRLKVLETTNLRVIDASVIPKITSGDIHLATVMLAEKAADMIKKDNNLI